MAVTEAQLVQILLDEQVRLMAYIRSIVISRDLSEDVFQEVSLVACASREEVSSSDAFPAWLRVVARNKAIAAIRKQKSSPTVHLDDATLDLLDSSWKRMNSNSTFSGRADRLEWCVSQMPSTGRELIELRYRENLGGAEIASKTNRSVASVYMALSRLRAALARCVRDSEVTHGE